MKYLVTGATGFFGRHLLQTLENDDSVSSVIALLRNTDDWESLDWTHALSKVTLLKGGLNDADDWVNHPSLTDVDGVFHLAAMVEHNRRGRSESFAVNVQGTLAMIDVAARLDARLVYMSTSGVVGCFAGPESSCDEDSNFVDERVAEWPYYASKIAAEKQGRERASEKNVSLVILRPPIMLGPGDHRFRSTSLILKILRRKLPFIIQGGFPYVDIRDVAMATLRAMQKTDPQPVYHLPGVQISVADLFRKVEAISGIKAAKHILPAGLVLAIAKTDEWLGNTFRGKPLGLVPDPVVIEMGSSYWGMTSKYAAADLGFNPRDADQTLRETVEWLLGNAPELQG